MRGSVGGFTRLHGPIMSTAGRRRQGARAPVRRGPAPSPYAARVPTTSSAGSPPPVVDRGPAGTLLAIGGAEDRVGRRTVLSRFVELAGGSRARIVLCATASSRGHDVVEQYDEVFRSLGAAEVSPVRPLTRADAADRSAAAAVEDATAVFLTGGNQLTLSQVVTGTAFGDAVVRSYRRGTVVGGTSAGASVLSEHMVAFGANGATPKQRMAQLARGLGLLPGVIVDQHVDQRGRHGRLLALVAQNPSLLGMGIDEDTGAVVSRGRFLEVVGRGSVLVVDGRHAVTDSATASRSRPLLVSGAVLHALPSGSRFDLDEVRLITPEETR
jgi:cyanophycinase